MSQLEKLLLRILRGTSDSNIGFDELCGLLTHLVLLSGCVEVITYSASQRSLN